MHDGKIHPNVATSKKEPKSYFASKQTLDKKHEIIYRILYVIFRKIGETM